jgi:protein phosphatase
MRIKIYPPLAIQELGNRDNQEDYIYPAHGKATASDCLFIVCDGMGGHENGEVASQTFAEALADYFRAHATCDTVLQDSVIAAALDHAYTKLDAADNGSYKKMGTTLTLLYFHRGGVTAAHIGDSRIYHLRPGKKLLYVSRDHSLVFDLYQSGEISYGEMKTSMQKNVITRAVQPGEDNRVKPDIIHITDVKPGDYFFMCSDGMVERMDDDDILNLFSGHGDDEKKMKKLISATASNQDNHSAYIIHVESVTIESEDELNTVNEENTARFNVLNMKPINANSTSIEEDDNDSTVVAPSTPSKPERTQRRKKKQSSWIWALLIAAIVAAAAWLALYGWGGTHEKEMPGETAPVIENNSVQNVEPTKPITSTVNHKPKPQRVNVVEPAAEASAASQQSTIDRYRDSVKESRKRHHAVTASADDNEKKSEND